MKKNKYAVIFAGLITASASGFTTAGPIGIFEASVFINAVEISGDSRVDTQIGDMSANNFASEGLSVIFSNGLDADNIGTMTWTITTGSDLSGVLFFGFLDADIDEGTNGSFNEYGVAGSSPSYDSWEIDEPGFTFGNIYDNLLDAALDNTNAVPSGSADDVSLALGLDIGDLLSNEKLVVTLTISSITDVNTITNDGLYQFDPNTNNGLLFTGSVEKQVISSIPIPEPTSLALMSTGLLLLGRHFKSKPSK